MDERTKPSPADAQPPPAPSDPIAQLQAFSEALHQQAAADNIRAIEHLLAMARVHRASESITLQGSEFVNRADYPALAQGFGSILPGFGVAPPYQPTVSDRDDGRDRPFIETECDVGHARAMGRWLSTLSCPAIGILENLKNYVIGPGFTFSAATKKGTEAPEGLIAAVQAVIDEFLDDNDFAGDLDRELFWRAHRDGEFFVTVTPSDMGRGRTAVRVVEPEQIIDPGHSPWSEPELYDQFGVDVPVASNWTFGIHSADHDVQTVFGYHVEWGPADVDYLPARFVEHHKINVDRNVKRGVSDFLPAWRWLQLQSRLLENTAEGASTLAAIAYIIQHQSGTTRASVESMRESMADWIYNYAAPSGIQKTVRRSVVMPGTTLDVPKGQEYLSGPAGHERGNSFLGVVQGILRQVATRWCMAEGMVSADDSNNAYASTVVAGSRFHRFAISSQATMRNRFSRIVWKALRIAFDAGRFARFGVYPSHWEQFQQLVELSVGVPDVDEQSKLEAEQIREIRHAHGVLSRKTWRGQVGLDDAIEEQHRDQETAEVRAAQKETARAFGDYP